MSNMYWSVSAVHKELLWALSESCSGILLHKTVSLYCNICPVAVNCQGEGRRMILPVTAKLLFFTFFQSLRRPFFLTCLFSTVSFIIFPSAILSCLPPLLVPPLLPSHPPSSTVSRSPSRATWLTKVHPTAWAGRSRIKLTASTTLSWRWSWWSGLTVSVVPAWESQNPESWVSRLGWRTDVWVHYSFLINCFSVIRFQTTNLCVSLSSSPKNFPLLRLIFPGPERAD